MPKLLLSLLLGFAISTPSFASHIMGGVINVSVDSTGTATFELHVYRDVRGIPFGFTQVDLDVSSATTAFQASVPVSLVSTDTISDTPRVMERLIFSGSTSLPPAVDYTVSYVTPCCLSISILNMSNLGIGSTITTKFSYTSPNANNTVVYLNDPVGKLPKDSLWTYDFMPYDVDGDSIHWSLGATGYIQGYTFPPSNPGGTLSIDPHTGVLSWNPSQTGVYVVGIFAEEWDNSTGTLQSETYHELQLIVVDDTSQLMIAPPNNVTTTPSGPTADFLAGTTNTLEVGLTSSFTNANLSLQASGEPFLLPNSNASFSVQKFKKQDSLVGTFTWNPDASLKGAGPYRVNFRFRDGSFTYDYTVTVNINGVISLNEDLSSSFTLYPNPSKGNFHLQPGIALQGEKIEIQVFNLNGSQLHAQSFDCTSSELEVNLDLPEGVYLITLQSNQYVQCSKLIIE
ncbi:MAG TPA: hypothetical protein DDW81_07455 [Cryomorphaceae bacterium]|nr:hypothetical protein [Cryomorphaceae bacterium]